MPSNTQTSDAMVRVAIDAFLAANPAARTVGFKEMRAALEAALAGHVVVPLDDLSCVVEVAHRNEYHPAISRIRAMISAAPPAQREG